MKYSVFFSLLLGVKVIKFATSFFSEDWQYTRDSLWPVTLVQMDFWKSSPDKSHPNAHRQTADNVPDGRDSCRHIALQIQIILFTISLDARLRALL